MTTVSVTTVGYGDLSPSSMGSKLFACVYVPVAVVFTGLAIDSIATAHTKRRLRQLEYHVIGQFAEARKNGTSRISDVYEYQELKRQAAAVRLDRFRCAQSRQGDVQPLDRHHPSHGPQRVIVVAVDFSLL